MRRKIATISSGDDVHSFYITLEAIREELRMNPWRLEKKKGGSEWYSAGNTPLISSTVFGNLEVCEYLLSVGANVEAKNSV